MDCRRRLLKTSSRYVTATFCAGQAFRGHGVLCDGWCDAVRHAVLELCDSMCRSTHKLATNLSLDPKLIERTVELSGEKTKKAAVTRALEEFVARREQKNVADLFGKLEWDPDFDHKTERKRI